MAADRKQSSARHAEFGEPCGRHSIAWAKHTCDEVGPLREMLRMPGKEGAMRGGKCSPFQGLWRAMACPQGGQRVECMRNSPNPFLSAWKAVRGLVASMVRLFTKGLVSRSESESESELLEVTERGINGWYQSTDCPCQRHFQPLVQRFSHHCMCPLPGWGVPLLYVHLYPPPPCISYANVRKCYGPYAHFSLDKGVACAQHIQLLAQTCACAWYECTLTSAHISKCMQTQESLGNMKISGSHPCWHKQ